MSRITSVKSFSAGPRREASRVNKKKLIILILIPVLVAAVFAAAFVKRDAIKSAVTSMVGGSGTMQPREEAGSEDPTGDIPEGPAASSTAPPAEGAPVGEVTPAVLHDAVSHAYASGVVHTNGVAIVGEKEVEFDTVWATDRSAGSGVVTFNGKQAEAYLVEKMLLLRNVDGVVGDIIGRPVPLEQWVIVNEDDAITNVFPDKELLDGVARAPEAREEGPNFVAGEFIVTLDEAKKSAVRVASPAGSWSIGVGEGSHVQVPGPDIQIDGKIEKDESGQWKVFRFTQSHG